MPRVSVSELGAEADEAAGRHEVLDAHPTGAVVDDLLHAPLAQGEQLGDDPHVLLGDVDGEPVDGLVHLAVDSLVSTCGLPTVSSKPSRRIISTRTASCSSPRPCTSQVSGRSVGSTRMLTLPTSSASSRSFTSRAVSCVPSWPASGDVLMPIVIARLGIVDVDHRERSRVVEVGQRLADRDLGDAGDGDDLAGTGLVGRHPVERLGDVELGDLGPLDRAVGAAPRHRLALARGAVATRHSASRPTYGDASRLVTSACSGMLGVVLGAGMRSSSRSSSGWSVGVVGQPGAVGGPLHRRLALARTQ